MLAPIEKFDEAVIMTLRKYGDEFARLAFFIIFYWFGILKVFMLSPANPLVVELLQNTFINFIPALHFLIYFGAFEMLLGTISLIPKLERVTFALLGFHLVTTVLPLFMLPSVTWDGFLVPTLIGQYIMKNIALAALSVLLYARLIPMTQTHSIFGEEID